jgi:arsenate reductase
MAARHNILVLCTGNSCRSQMAEAFLRKMIGVRYDVYSAGTAPQPQIHPLAVQVMQERGIDISTHRPKDVQEFLGRLTIRHLIIVCGDAEESCPRTFVSVLHRHFLPFNDPAKAMGSQADF